MKRRIGEYCNGTSAIDLEVRTSGSCRIIRPEFPLSRSERERSACEDAAGCHAPRKHEMHTGATARDRAVHPAAAARGRAVRPADSVRDRTVRACATARGRAVRPAAQPGLARRIFESSEMLCSIAFEDHRGCAYGIFSRGEVIATSVIVSVLAALAIALGA